MATKLYLYQMHRTPNCIDIKVTALDAEERENSYMVKATEESLGYSVNKADIGKIVGINNDKCYLLTDNPSDAIKIFKKPILAKIDELYEKITAEKLALNMLCKREKDCPANFAEIDFLSTRRKDSQIAATFIAAELNISTEEYLAYEEHKKSMPRNLYQMASAFVSKHAEIL